MSDSRHKRNRFHSDHTVASSHSISMTLPLLDGCSTTMKARKERAEDVSKLAEFPQGVKDMVRAALRRSRACTAADLEAIRNMDPGIRELRLRNFISSQWTEPDWNARLLMYREAKTVLERKLKLPPPKDEEMLKAITSAGELSQMQAHFICSALDKKVVISAENIIRAKAVFSSI